MDFKEYQEKAMTTCLHVSANFSYMMLNLVAELGELAGKIGKAIRKEQMCIGGGNDKVNELCYAADLANEDVLEKEQEMMKEAGDVLWQFSGLCTVMGWSLEEVAQMNLDKLASRKQRRVIDGNGDNR